MSIGLRNENIALTFDNKTGALTGIRAIKTGWELIKNPTLGMGFNMLVPHPDKRNTKVHGEKQLFSRYEESEDKLQFHWDQVTTEQGATLPIKVTTTITLEDGGAVFAIHVDNQSPYIIENVIYPYLGDIEQPEGAEWMKAFYNGYAGAAEQQFWPKFNHNVGYYGTDCPTQLIDSHPHSPFVLLRTPQEGLLLYIRSQKFDITSWITELRPGYGDSCEKLVPETDEIGGVPVCLRFAPVQFPYIKPGESRSLMPIAMHTYAGDWHKGVDIYRQWRETWRKTAMPPPWAKEAHNWQQLHINSPEDELRVRFTDLPKYGRECAARGVKVIQLVGWNHGGQDQGNPSHDPDPRLGTFDELKSAIAEIQAMGVKMILFAKFTWTDRGTEWFRNGLKDLAVKDPYGDYYMHPGYRYQTMTQITDINTKRLIPMCFNEKYLEICCHEFQKMVDLGADGILFDECFHHTPALMCFDESHGHPVGWSVYAHDNELIKRFRDMLPAEKRENFMFAGETNYDHIFEEYDVSYLRSFSDHVPLMRYLNPHSLMMTASTGFKDRNMLNHMLMYRYISSYEPYHFKGSIEDYPETMDYGAKIDALRDDAADYLWDGEFRHEDGACVVVEGKPEQKTPFSLFKHKNNGSECVVVCNYSKEPIAVKVSLESGKPLTSCRTAEAGWVACDNGATIPPQSVCVFK